MAQLRLSALARADIVDILSWTGQRFGNQVLTRYEKLLSTSLRDLGADPVRLGSISRPELGDGVRSYHLRHSRDRFDIARPRHLILYRIVDKPVVEIGRVLHDAMELERHIIFDFPPEP